MLQCSFVSYSSEGNAYRAAQDTIGYVPITNVRSYGDNWYKVFRCNKCRAWHYVKADDVYRSKRAPEHKIKIKTIDLRIKHEHRR